MISVLFTILMVCAFLGTGRVINRYVLKVGLESIYKNIIIDFATGFGVGSYYLFFIGLLGYLYRPVAFSFLGISFLLFCVVYFYNTGKFKYILERLKTTLREVKQISNGEFPDSVIVFILGVLFVQFVVGVLVSFAPPTNADALYYHFVPIKKYLEASRIYPIFDNPWSFVPQFIEMIYLYPFLIYDFTVPTFLNSIFLVGIYALIIIISREMFDTITGVIACGIFCSMPMTIYIVTNPKPDAGFTFFSLLSFYLFFEGIKHKKVNYFILSGVFTGFAIVSKTCAAIVLIANVVLLCCLRRRECLSINQWIYFTVFFVFSALIVASPWFIKNWFWVNNPIKTTEMNVHRIGGFKGVLNMVLEFAISPWLMNSNISKYGNRIDLISPLYLCFIPFVFMVKKPEARKVLRHFLVWALTCYFCWFFIFKTTSMGPRGRYLLPAIPIFAILAAHVVRNLNSLWRSKLKAFVNVIFCGVIFLNLTIFISYSTQFLPVVFKFCEKDKFLSEKTWNYKDIVWINKHLTEKDRILTFTTMNFYLEIPFICCLDYLFNYKNYRNQYDFLRELKKKEITHILWLEDESLIDYSYFNKEFETVFKQVLKKHCGLVYENKESVLGYRVSGRRTVPLYLYEVHYPADVL